MLNLKPAFKILEWPKSMNQSPNMLGTQFVSENIAIYLAYNLLK